MQEQEHPQENIETSDHPVATTRQIGRIIASNSDYITMSHTGPNGVASYTFVELSDEDGSRSQADASPDATETN